LGKLDLIADLQGGCSHRWRGIATATAEFVDIECGSGATNSGAECNWLQSIVVITAVIIAIPAVVVIFIDVIGGADWVAQLG
jgi:hypothetical protein